MRRLISAVVLLSGVASADELGARLGKNLGDMIANGISQVSLGVVALKLDVLRGRGAFSVGGGSDDGKLAMRFDGKVKMEDGVARVHAHVDLSAFGGTLNLDLPELDLSTATVGTQRVVQVSIPVCRFHF